MDEVAGGGGGWRRRMEEAPEHVGALDDEPQTNKTSLENVRRLTI